MWRRLFPEWKFDVIYPSKPSSYSYTNFLRAVAQYPAVCSPTCPRVLATMFAHIQQETAGLPYTKEIQRSDYCADWAAWVTRAYTCVPGRQYYGRGTRQLSWNYDAFSKVPGTGGLSSS